jgi:predicted AAA+ superfamily ATPase
LLFFDEIQSAVHWELYARQKLDEGFQLTITGSNASFQAANWALILPAGIFPKSFFLSHTRNFAVSKSWTLLLNPCLSIWKKEDSLNT